MDEQEPDKQFEATDYDEDDNIKLPPPPVAAEKKKRITVAELNKAIDDIQDVKFPETLEWIGELATRIDKLEKGPLPDRQNVAEDIAAKLDNQDTAIGALADMLRSHLEEPAAAPQPAETEIEFAQPPQQKVDETVDKSSIETTASVCQTMNDVLMITRALREIPELTDAERNKILDTAGKAAGVIIAPGLQIRAGVKFTGA